MTTKSDLINTIAKKSGLTKSVSEKSLNACLDSIQEALSKEEKLKIIGFGSFSVEDRKEREARNPQTGEKITVPSKKVVKFKPGKKLKEEIR